jgi:peptidyl-prolyl cis-trans isomerase B (cyclophilin B)
VQLVEGGCPLGSGDSRVGSLGYWLKPEFSAEPLHDVGAVGASHYEEADTAACKFYIMLNKAPHLDGVYTVFGRVTKGLDVVRKIYTQPVVETDASPAGYQRPVKPVVITKVTIHGLPG